MLEAPAPTELRIPGAGRDVAPLTRPCALRARFLVTIQRVGRLLRVTIVIQGPAQDHDLAGVQQSQQHSG